MSKALVEKMRKARDQNVTVDGHTYIVRRPRDGDLREMPDSSTFEFVKRFVVGWDFKELDLIPGGGPEPVEFEPFLWTEWAADHAEVWEELAAPMLDAYTKHKEAVRATEKN